jgi:hypothetical protein
MANMTASTVRRSVGCPFLPVSNEPARNCNVRGPDHEVVRREVRHRDDRAKGDRLRQCPTDGNFPARERHLHARSEGPRICVDGARTDRCSLHYVSLRVAHLGDGGRPSWQPVIGVVLPPPWHQGHEGQPMPRTAAPAITPGPRPRAQWPHRGCTSPVGRAGGGRSRRRQPDV